MRKTFIETHEFTEYAKGEQEDLTTDQRKVLKTLAGEYKRAAIRAAEVFKKGSS